VTGQGWSVNRLGATKLFEEFCKFLRRNLVLALAFLGLPAVCAQCSCSLGGGAKFFGDFLGFLGIEVQRKLDPPFGFDVDADHSCVGRPDLQVGGDVGR
jgi:hypothetical protein